MKTTTDSLGYRHERVIDALADLERAALDYSTTGRADHPRKRLAKAAVEYSAALRRLAGVR